MPVLNPIARLVLVVTLAIVAPLSASSVLPLDTNPPPASRPSAPLPRDRADILTVHIRLKWDPSIRSTFIRTVLEQEAADIWKANGVEIIWSDAEVDAIRHLDVVVARHQSGGMFTASEAAAGITRMDRLGMVQGPIRLMLDRIESLMEMRDGKPVLHDRELARALGRVLAHELGHVLLGAAHDRQGLMRPSIPIDDFAGPDRERFALSQSAASRLQALIACLSRNGGQPGCTPGVGAS